MLKYASGAVLYGSNIREALEQLSAILVSLGFPAITIVDGDREYQKQVDIFLQRYVLAGKVGGRRVYDVRWWEGRQYFRISSAGTVAPPSRTAPHVARIAADLGAPYNNRNTAAHKRLQQLAPAFGIRWTGVNFGEDWHWETVRGVGIVGLPSSGAGSTPFVPKPAPTPAPLPDEEDEMLALKVKDSGAEHTVTLGVGVLSHMILSDDPDKVMRQLRSRDDWTEVTVNEFDILLARHGVDRDAYRFISTTTGANLGAGKGGQLVVKNPATGQYWTGQTWSAWGALRAELAGRK